MPQVLIGILAIDMPNSRMVKSRHSVRKLRPVVKKQKQPVVSVIMVKPVMASTRGPKRSKSMPVIGLMMPMRIAPGSIKSPDCIAP